MGFTVPAVLTVDNSVVDLETIEALYENVSIQFIAVVGGCLIKGSGCESGECYPAHPPGTAHIHFYSMQTLH